MRTEIRLPGDETKLAFLLDNVAPQYIFKFSNTDFTFHDYFSSKVLTDDECRALIKETESIGYEPARSFKFILIHALFGYEPARFSKGSLNT